MPNLSREAKFPGTNVNRDFLVLPCSADHEQDWQPYAVDPYSCYMCYHTYSGFILRSVQNNFSSSDSVITTGGYCV